MFCEVKYIITLYDLRPGFKDAFYSDFLKENQIYGC